MRAKPPHRRVFMQQRHEFETDTTISGCLSRKCSAITTHTPPGPHSLAGMTAR